MNEWMNEWMNESLKTSTMSFTLSQSSTSSQSCWARHSFHSSLLKFLKLLFVTVFENAEISFCIFVSPRRANFFLFLSFFLLSFFLSFFHSLFSFFLFSVLLSTISQITTIWGFMNIKYYRIGVTSWVSFLCHQFLKCSIIVFFTVEPVKLILWRVIFGK